MSSDGTVAIGGSVNIPHELSSTLIAAFGSSMIEGWQPMLGGRSDARLYSFQVGSRAYVLRHLNADRSDHQAKVNREFLCTTLASQLGVAPAVQHVDTVNGVIISDRIPFLPISASPRAVDFTPRLAFSLKKLHSGPPFPVGQTLLESMSTVQSRITDLGFPGIPKPLIDTIEIIASAIAPFAESAPCHHDLNPTNIIDTGDAIYFLDWEIACMSDPFIDIGQLGVFVFPSPDMRRNFLTSYLGQDPTPIHLARELLGRIIALAFYVVAFIKLSVESGNLSKDMPAPLPLHELFTLVSTRPQEASPALFASCLYNEMLIETRSMRFTESIELIRSSS